MAASTDNSCPRVLLVDEDRVSRAALSESVQQQGWEPIAVPDGDQALAQLDDRVAVIVSDLKTSGTDGMRLLRAAQQLAPRAAVILTADPAMADAAVEAFEQGAFDFVCRPFQVKELVQRIERALEKRTLVAEVSALQQQLNKYFGIDNLVGRSAAMQDLLEKVRLVADANRVVLLTGERGTGKELIARLLHVNSSRRDKPFVPVNCTAVPEPLMESELFGSESDHDFSRAEKRKGAFQMAQGGTLFIDEISELSLTLQSKLLRAIVSQQVLPVGSKRETAVDVRLIVSTTQDLAQVVQDGDFREDLYDRLKDLALRLPPLRERRDDIPLLVRFFIDEITAETQRPIRDIAPEALQVLREYDWPGNVRELRNTLEAIVVLSSKNRIDLVDVPEHIRHADRDRSPPVFGPGMKLSDMEREAIRQTLQLTSGHRGNTAKRLGLSVRTLQRKIKLYQLATNGKHV